MNNNRILFVIYSLTGASMVAIALTGARLLDSNFGMSFQIWTVVISIALAAICIGRLLGRIVLEKKVKAGIIVILLLVAGGWMLLIPWLIQPILKMLKVTSFHFSLVATAIILFFPPFVLLEMVQSITLKLNAGSDPDAKRCSEHCFLISALSGVFAAWVIGFGLAPFIGIEKIITGIGFLLWLTSGGIFWGLKKNIMSALLVVGIVTSCVIGIRCAEKLQHPVGMIFHKQSPYNEICVVDQNGIRTMQMNGRAHVVINPETHESLQRSVIAMNLTQYFFLKSGRVLLIGLGGGSIAQNFTIEGWKVDVLETDPVVVDVAQRYFGLQKKDCRIIAIDARKYLTESATMYDLIIIASFSSNSVPIHLLTAEAFSMAASRLNPAGIVAINIEAIGWENIFIQSVAKTLNGEFKNITALPLNEPPDAVGHIILLAANRELTFPEDWLEHPKDYAPADPYQHWVVMQKNHAWDNRFIPDMKDAILITDDCNPVDGWAQDVTFRVRTHAESSDLN
jgi:spermidine synthase